MIERTILSALVYNPDYLRKVIPFIEKDYFANKSGEQIVFALIQDHFRKYNTQPTKSIVGIELDKKKLPENFYVKAEEVINSLIDEPVDIKWLVDSTEEWCKRRAFFNAIVTASDLISDDTKLFNGALDLVSKALSVSFDSDLGTDYFDDAAERFDKYKLGVDKVPCGINIFDTVTKGGFVNPSLTVFMAPTGVGKSLFLCNMAAAFLAMGKNVVYFTMEMSQLQVEQRIDLNLLDVNLDQLMSFDKMQFTNRIGNIKKKMAGKLRTKEYPSGSAHSGHFRYFLEELKLKENFIPDVIIVDYLNICSSARTSKSAGLYDFNGTIAVELRGLGQEFHCPVFTATQTNREGTKTSDFDHTDIADSWGITHHADYIYGIIETEDLAKMWQMKIKRLKDRYQDYKSWYPSFIIGVDKQKQRIYDITENSSEPDEWVNDKQFEDFMS